MTNFEKIKAMNFEEMAKFLERNSGCGTCTRRDQEDTCAYVDCLDYIRDWLNCEAN